VGEVSLPLNPSCDRKVHRLAAWALSAGSEAREAERSKDGPDKRLQACRRLPTLRLRTVSDSPHGFFTAAKGHLTSK
jgi:hypothetical protein